jgi:hypothetical protein
MVNRQWRTHKGMDANKISRFRDIALMELKRAERYRNFLSLLVLNLSEFLSTAGRRKITSDEEATRFMESLINRIQKGARETDVISGARNAHLVMLLPETNQVGAEIAAKRFRKLLSEFLADYLDSDYRFDIPLEITSFPDQSGLKHFTNRLETLFSSRI